LYKRCEAQLERVGDEMVIAPEKFRAWAVEQAGSVPIRWISPDTRALTETPGCSASRNSGEVVETASPVLAPVIGRLGYQLAAAGRLTDVLAVDANYVRRSDAEVAWTDRNAP
jgi:hypothetical protein